MRTIYGIKVQIGKNSFTICISLLLAIYGWRFENVKIIIFLETSDQGSDSDISSEDESDKDSEGNEGTEDNNGASIEEQVMLNLVTIFEGIVNAVAKTPTPKKRSGDKYVLCICWLYFKRHIFREIVLLSIFKIFFIRILALWNGTKRLGW